MLNCEHPWQVSDINECAVLWACGSRLMVHVAVVLHCVCNSMFASSMCSIVHMSQSTLDLHDGLYDSLTPFIAKLKQLKANNAKLVT